MNWQRIDKLSNDLADVMDEIIQRHNWILGEDIVIGKLTSQKRHVFCNCVRGKYNIKEYKIRCCGRFFVSFELKMVKILMEKLSHP